MGFINIVKKVMIGDEKQVKEQKPAAISAKEEAARARQGSEDICDKLSALQFKDHTYTISEETMQIYQAIVEGLIMHLRKANAIALDTTEIDSVLCRIVTLLQKAINEGHGKTANDICKMLKESIEKDRTEISAPTKEDKDFELEIRISRLDKQYTVFECRLKVDALEKGVAELDKKIAEDKKRYTQAKDVLQKMVDENPDLVEDLKKIAIIAPGHPHMGLLLLMDNAKKNVVNIYNAINREESIKALKKQRITALRNQIDGIETIILKAADRLNPQILERMEKFNAEYEEIILKEQKENREMEELSADLDRITDMVMTSEDMINGVIATDMAFRKIMKQEQEREEGIRIAQENAKKRQHTQTVRQTNING